MNSDNRKESFKLLGLSGSDSGSDIPEFTIPRRKVKIKKKFRSGSLTARPNGIRHVRACSAIYVFKILGVLVIAVGLGITVWLAVTLLIKVDELKKQYLQVEESSKGAKSEFHVIHSQLNELQKNHTAFKDDVAQLNKTLEGLLKDVAALTKTAADLQKSIKEAPQLEKLPKDVESILNSVALLGSQINDVQSNLGQVKEQMGNNDKDKQDMKDRIDALKKKIEGLVAEQQKYTNSESTALPSNLEINKLQDALFEANNSIWQKLQWSISDLHEHHEIITDLQKLAQNLTQRINSIESRPINTSAIVAAVLQDVQEQLKSLVNVTITSTLNKIVPDSLPSLTDINGTVTIESLLNYLHSLSQLYVALVAQNQAVPTGQLHSLNETLNINLPLLVQEAVSAYVNSTVSQQDLKIKELLASVNDLMTSYKSLKSNSDVLNGNLAALQEEIGKLHTGNQSLILETTNQVTPSLPIVTTNTTAPAPQPSPPSPNLITNTSLPSMASTALATPANGTATNSTSSPGRIPKPSHTGGSLQDEEGPPKTGSPTN